jgi:hypothetical protein
MKPDPFFAPNYRPGKRVRLDPLFFGQGFFKRPSADRYNEHPPESDKFDNAPAAITLLHELGHRLLQIDDPTHYNYFRGTILVLENVFRYELEVDKSELRKAYTYRVPKLDIKGNPLKDSEGNIVYMTKEELLKLYPYLIINYNPHFGQFAQRNIEDAVEIITRGDINYGRRRYRIIRNPDPQLRVLNQWNKYSNTQWKRLLDFIDPDWAAP